MNEVKLTFPERIDRLEAASRTLMDIASVLSEEAAQMQTAAKRFAEKRPPRTGTKARR